LQMRAAASPRPPVVLQLDDNQTLYRELRPHRVDAKNHTVTVRTNTLSTFLPCTPGIEIDNPGLFQDAAGELIHYTRSAKILVAGHVVDDRAAVALAGAPFDGNWMSLGYFEFDDVSLGQGSTDIPLTLTVTVNGLLPHSCGFVVRRTLPPKFIG